MQRPEAVYPLALPVEILECSSVGRLSDGAVVIYAFVLQIHAREGTDTAFETEEGESRGLPHDWAEIAKDRGTTEKKIREHLAELEAAGWVERDEHGVLVFLRERRVA